MDDISDLIKTHGIDHVIKMYGITSRDWDRAIDSNYREIGGFPIHDAHAQNVAIVSRVLEQRNSPPKGYKPDGHTENVVPANLSKKQFAPKKDEIRYAPPLGGYEELMDNDTAVSQLVEGITKARNRAHRNRD